MEPPTKLPLVVHLIVGTIWPRLLLNFPEALRLPLLQPMRQLYSYSLPNNHFESLTIIGRRTSRIWSRTSEVPPTAPMCIEAPIGYRVPFGLSNHGLMSATEFPLRCRSSSQVQASHDGVRFSAAYRDGVISNSHESERINVG